YSLFWAVGIDKVDLQVVVNYVRSRHFGTNRTCHVTGTFSVDNEEVIAARSPDYLYVGVHTAAAEILLLNDRHPISTHLNHEVVAHWIAAPIIRIHVRRSGLQIGRAHV